MPNMRTIETYQIPEIGFLRVRQILTVIPVSQTEWYRGVKARRYPQPVRLGPRTVAWRAQDIRDLIERIEKGAA